MQERPRRVRAFAFEIRGEIAPQLAFASHAGHHRIDDGLAAFERQRARCVEAQQIAMYRGMRLRQLEADVHLTHDERHAVERAARMRILRGGFT
jgi:hypothetical protein